MTYPPQGQYGQQPDPYGQQQPQYGGGYQQQPQYGQDPNAQQQYGGGYGQDPNAQYGGGYGQQYGGLGGGPQPPKNKGPIIAVVAIVVLVLAGVGVTGFVAPGFFLSDDKEGSNTGSGTSSSSAGNKDNGSEAFIKKLVTAADNKDKTALKGLTCSDASDDVSGATNSIDEIDSAELKDTREVSDTEVVATLNIVVDGKDGDYEATVVKDGADWCWSDITSESGGSSSSEETTTSEETTETSGGGGAPIDDSSPGAQYVKGFLDKVNAGDGEGAAAMTCPESADNKADITEAVGQGAKIDVNPDGSNSADDTSAGIDLVGTLNGQAASGRVSAFTDDAGNFCIYTFFFYKD